MEENLTTALYLMLIGMATVFTVLALVVGSGRLLIRAVNRFSPPDTSTLRRPKQAVAATSPTQVAAIVAAVSIVTRGKGRIVQIEKE